MSRRAKVQCSRCRRRATTKVASRDLWNVTVEQGRAIGALCPACQTTEENIEAEINHATTDYGMNAFGQLIGRPKTGDRE